MFHRTDVFKKAAIRLLARIPFPRAGFTGTADVYSLGRMIAELSMKYLNVPGMIRRSVLTIDNDWENDIANGTACLAVCLIALSRSMCAILNCV